MSEVLRPEMGERPELPEQQRRTVELVGWLVQQPTARYATSRRESVIRAHIDVETHLIPVIAYGKCAEEFSAIPTNAAVKVTGIIYVANRQIKKAHVILDVEAKSVQVLASPRRRNLV